MVKQVLLVNKELVIIECNGYADGVVSQVLSAGGLAYRRIKETVHKFKKKFIAVEQN